MSNEIARLSIAVDSTGVAKARQDLDGLSASGAKASSMVKGLVAAMGLGVAANKFVEVNTEFQRLNMQIVTFTRSQEKANSVFGDLQKFAATTPFQLREVANAWTVMKARGMDPSMDSMRALGDLSSALGRNLGDMVAAVGSAAAGNTEMLKMMGVQTSVVGDKVRLTLNGVTEVVGRSAYEIEQALVKISQSQFTGAMERQMDTLGGALSNLKDQVDLTFYAMGQGGANNELVRAVRGVSEALAGATPRMVSMTNAVVGGSADAIAFLERHKQAVMMLAAVYGSIRIGQMVASWEKPLRDFVGAIQAAAAGTKVFDAATASYIVQGAGAAGVATKGLNAAMAALGGPVGAAAAALLAVGAAALIFGNQYDEGTRKALKASQDFVASLRDELVLLDRRAGYGAKDVGAGGPAGPKGTDVELKGIQQMEHDAAEMAAKIASMRAAAQEAARQAAAQAGMKMDEATVARATTPEIERQEKALAELNFQRKVALEYIKQHGTATAEDQKRQAAEAAGTAATLKAQADKLAADSRAAAEAKKLTEEKENFIKSLRDENAAWGQDEEAILYAKAARYGLIGTEELLTRATQLRVDAVRKAAEEEAKLRDLENQREQESAKNEEAARAKTKLDALWATYAALNKVSESQSEYRQGLERLNKLMVLGAITPEQYRQGLVTLQSQLVVVTSAFGDITQSIEQWGTRFTDTLVEACFTGKLAVSDFVTSVMKDLARLSLQQSVTSPLFGALSQWINGLLPSGGSSSGLDMEAASGGYRSGSKPYLVGENGPEIFNPGKAGTITPTEQVGRGGVTNVITIQVSSDGASGKDAQGQGQDVLKTLKPHLDAWARQEMAYGGIFYGR